MDIGENISDSIRYPTSDLGKLLILGIIMIIPLVNFIGMGYFLRALKSNLAGISELPNFDDVGELFIEGLKLFIVGIIYSIPVWIIAAGLGAGQNVIMNAGMLSGAALYALILGYIIYVILAIIIGFIEIIAVANLAYNDGEFSAAFRFTEILGHISQIGWADYIIWYIVVVLVSLIIGLIAVAITFALAITIIGIILIPVLFILVISYISLFYARSLSLLFLSQEKIYSYQESVQEPSK